MSLVQLHHQMANGETTFVAQAEINGLVDMRTFFETTNASHPLPAGAVWRAVPENNKDFVVSLVHPGDTRS